MTQEQQLAELLSAVKEAIAIMKSGRISKALALLEGVLLRIPK